MQARLDKWEKGLRVGAAMPTTPLSPLNAIPKALNVSELAQELSTRAQKLAKSALTICQEVHNAQSDSSFRSLALAMPDVHDKANDGATADAAATV